VFVLVEHPLPWPPDIADDPALAELQSVAAAAVPGRSVRLQAAAVEPAALLCRVVVFAAGDGPFSGYGRVERSARPEELADVVAKLVASPPPPAPAGVVTDVLICTHGSRDACCGSLGTARFVEERSPGGVEVCFEAPDGERGGYLVYVEPARHVAVPDCGADPAFAAKTQAELRVTGIRAWA
jgi:hypothetical protein